MNLFGINEKKKIDMGINLGSPVNLVTSPNLKPNFNTNFSIKAFSDNGNFVDITITNLFPNNTKNEIVHSFNEEQLDVLVKQLAEIKEKLINNKKSEEYPLEQVERLYFNIIENHCKVKFGSTRIPRPKINVYMDDDEIRLTAVDFHNNKIIMNHIISVEYLNFCIVDNTIDDIFEGIVNAISSELNSSMKNRRGIFKGDEQFKYLGEHYVEEIKTIGAENIIREYLFNSTTIEDDVVNLFLEGK